MAANWWADPMPPGWEAKWDPGQQRYFFINHSTKKTSWTDPRSPEGRYQIKPQEPARQPVAIPMQSMSPRCAQCHIKPVDMKGHVCHTCTAKNRQQQIRCGICNTNTVSKSDDVCATCMQQLSGRGQQPASSILPSKPESSFTNQASVEEDDLLNLFVRADEQLVKKLKHAYPTAIESHVRSALESNDNNEAKAHRDLEKRGYKKVSQKEIEAEKMLAKLKPEYQQCGDDLLKATIITCNCVEVTTRKKLRELGFLTRQEKLEEEKKMRAEKERKSDAEKNIRRDFPSVSSDVIAMALESAEYDEELTRRVLTSMYSPDKPATSASRPEPAAATVLAKTHAPVTVTSGAQAKGKGKQPVKPANSGTPAKKLVTHATPKKDSPAKKQTPHVTQPKLSRSRDSRGKIGADREGKNRDVVHRIGPSKLAHGPDSTLPSGPQDSLLLTGYCDVMGPNSDLVKGPLSQVMGSRGACGADPSLVHGPAGYKHYQAVQV